MDSLAESELVRGLSPHSLRLCGVGCAPDKPAIDIATYPLVVPAMRRCIGLHLTAGTYKNEFGKIAAADILADAGFTMSDIVEHIDDVLAPSEKD